MFACKVKGEGQSGKVKCDTETFASNSPARQYNRWMSKVADKFAMVWSFVSRQI